MGKEDSDASSSEEEETSDFFERTPFLASAVVLVGVIGFYILCFQTSSFPFHLLGKPGRRLKYLTDNYLLRLQLGFAVVILIHLIESLYSYFLARKLGMSSGVSSKWAFQSFFVGFLSLRILQDHQANVEKSLKKW